MVIPSITCVVDSTLLKIHTPKPQINGFSLFCVLFQDNLLIPKRSKPSLSIVNPLDTLRQRIMLEMSRRQMREKEKQVIILCVQLLVKKNILLLSLRDTTRLSDF